MVFRLTESSDRSYSVPTDDVPMIEDPVAAYQRMAPVYTLLCGQRRNYLSGIDRLVVERIPTGSRSLLDVGSGDGRRALGIALAASIADLTFLEPALDPPGAKILRIRAEALNSVDTRFDVVTCLWNVLGHIFPASGRLEVLRQFARLTSPSGKVFLDVSHRHNARHYGLCITTSRFLRDQFTWNETTGDVVVAWNTGGICCKTRGHVFTRPEMLSLFAQAGLTIEQELAVDYATGMVRGSRFLGNLFYVLRPVA